MQKARAQLALLRFARLIVCQLGSISSLRLIPTIHSFSSLRVQRNTHGALANPDLSQAMAPSKQKRTHAVFRVSSAHRLASTSKPRFVGEKVKLGELCNVCSGGTPKRSVPEYWNEGSIPWVKISDISSKFVSSTEEQITEAGLEGSSAKLLAPGTLLYSIFASIGAVGILKIPAATNQAIAGLSIRTDRIERDYLYHYLKSQEALAKSSGRGVAQNNINLTILRGMEIPVPAIDEQRIIVEQLEMVAAQIKQAETQLAKLDSLVKSRFVEMFESKDYGMRPMGDLVESITAGTNVGGQQRPLGEGEYGVLKISAVTQGVFNPGELKAVNDVSHIKMIHPRKGDLLFSRANTSEMVGATAIVDKDYGDLFLPDKLWRLDPTDEVETVFLKALLSSPSIRAEMSKVSTGSSGSMQNISMAKFRKLPAFLPPLALQQEFAAFASQVDKSRFVRDHEINFRWERFTLSWPTIA